METSLHRELKLRYAGPDARTEVRFGRYRVDAVAGGELIEIQNGPLAAISAKIADLLLDHAVRIVKPIVHEKLLVKRRPLDPAALRGHCGALFSERHVTAAGVGNLSTRILNNGQSKSFG